MSTRDAFEQVGLDDLEHERGGFRQDLLRALRRDDDLAFDLAGGNDQLAQRVVLAFDGIDQFALHAARDVVRRGVVDRCDLERAVAVGDRAQQFDRDLPLDLLHRLVVDGERDVGGDILVEVERTLREIELVFLRRVVFQPRIAAGNRSGGDGQQQGRIEKE